MKLLKLAIPILIFLATLAGGLSTAQAQDPDLTDSLLGHWKLDETSGDRINIHTSAYTLSDSTSTGYVSGKINNAAYFQSASSDKLDFQDSLEDILGQGSNLSWTAAMWVKPDATASGGHLIRSLSGSGVASSGWGLRVSGADPGPYTILSTVNFLDAGGSNRVVSNNSGIVGINTSAWTFVAFVHEFNVGTFIYVNGSLDNFEPLPSSTSIYPRPSTYTNLGQLFDGAIDSLSIWTHPLTATEITAIYNNGNGLDYENFSPNQTINVTVILTPTIIVSPTFSLTPTIALTPSFNITNNVILTPTTPYTSITNPETGNEIHLQRLYTHGDIAIAVPLWFLVLLGVYWRVQVVIKGN